TNETSGSSSTQTFLLATKTVSTRSRREARRTISLISVGRASASTHILIGRFASSSRHRHRPSQWGAAWSRRISQHDSTLALEHGSKHVRPRDESRGREGPGSPGFKRRSRNLAPTLWVHSFALILKSDDPTWIGRDCLQLECVVD